MNRLHRLFGFLVLPMTGLGFFTAFGWSQDKKDSSAQKDAISASLKRADLTTAKVVETDHFFVVGTLPEEKAKVLGSALEKLVPIARKGLEYEAKEEPWKGKLAVYYFPEGRDFKGFLRSAVMVRPEGPYFDLRSDAPFVVDPVEVAGTKVTEADQFASTSAVVAGAFLKARGNSAALPEWLIQGFGRATSLRSEGLMSKRYLAYKTQVKAMVAGKSGPVAVGDLWAESKPANAELLGTSVLEYMAHGPGASNFLKFVYGFRPDENGNTPTVAQALEAAGWKDVPALEKAWIKWVGTGK